MPSQDRVMYNNWIKPTLSELEREFHVEQELKGHKFWEDWDEFLEATEKATVYVVTPENDRKIAYRSRTRSYEDLISLIKGYRSYPEFRNAETIKNLYKRIQENKPLYMPIVIFNSEGKMRVFSGNTRMDVAFQLGENPHVLLVEATW